MSNKDLSPQEGLPAVAGETSTVPRVGELAYDCRSDRVGQVMELRTAYALLRPPGGGREWDVPLGYVHSADRADELRARVAELNAASRSSRWGL